MTSSTSAIRKPRRIIRWVFLGMAGCVFLFVAGFWYAWTFVPDARVRILLWELDRLPKARIDFFYVGRSSAHIERNWDQLGEESVPALCSVLQDRSVHNRYLAAGRLEKIGDRRADGTLIEALHDSDNIIVRVWAASALGCLKCREAVPALVEAIKDPNPGVRREATAALCEIGDPAAVPLLLELLSDESPLVRGFSTWALQDLCNASIVPRLRQLAENDPDAWVREQTTKSLEQLSKKNKASRDAHN